LNTLGSQTLIAANVSSGVSFSQAAGSPFPLGYSPDAVAVADLNGDGKPDLAVANDYL